MNVKHLLKTTTVLAALVSLVGCVNNAPKPDNPYYAPVPPSAMVAPKQLNGSIYQAGHGLTLYEDSRARRVGDILTVVLTESTSASKSADNDINKQSSISIAEPTVFGSRINNLSASIDGGTRNFVGESEATQQNSLSGNITVTVANVLPNGVMQVRGEKWITLTDGDEYIRISGLVRPQDVSSENTIVSTKLADARITYSGTGEFHDASKMGWISKFFMSPLWPL